MSVVAPTLRPTSRLARRRSRRSRVVPWLVGLLAALLANSAIAAGLAHSASAAPAPMAPLLVQRVDSLPVPIRPAPAPEPEPQPEPLQHQAAAGHDELLAAPAAPLPTAPALPALELPELAAPEALRLPALPVRPALSGLPTALAAGSGIRSDSGTQAAGGAATAAPASSDAALPVFDEAPRLLSALDAARHYPRDAAARGLHGSTRLRLELDADGAVQRATVLHSSPSGVFEQAALRLVRDLRYAPARRDGRPVPCRHDLELTWTTE